jgi:hypothetical protein
MKPSDRTGQGPRVRFWGERVAGRCLPSASALPSVPLGVNPSPRRRGETTVPLAVLVKGFPPEQELPLESP